MMTSTVHAFPHGIQWYALLLPATEGLIRRLFTDCIIFNPYRAQVLDTVEFPDRSSVTVACFQDKSLTDSILSLRTENHVYRRFCFFSAFSLEINA